jgi:hypothetical protein
MTPRPPTTFTLRPADDAARPGRPLGRRFGFPRRVEEVRAPGLVREPGRSRPGPLASASAVAWSPQPPASRPTAGDRSALPSVIRSNSRLTEPRFIAERGFWSARLPWQETVAGSWTVSPRCADEGQWSHRLRASVTSTHGTSLSASHCCKMPYVDGGRAFCGEYPSRSVLLVAGQALAFRLMGATGRSHPRAGPSLSSLDANCDDSPVGARSTRGHHHRPPMEPRSFARRPGA